MDRAFQINDADSLMLYAGQLLQSDSPLLRARAIGANGWAYYLRGEYTLALEYYHQALALHTELTNTLGMAGTYGNISQLLTTTNDLVAALEHARRALSLYESIEHRDGIATVTGNIGAIYVQLADYPSAMEYFNRAIAQHEELGDASGVAIFTAGIGQVLSSIGSYLAALEHLQRAVSMLLDIGNKSNAAGTLINIGNVHLYQDNFIEALNYYQQAKALVEESGSTGEMPTVIVNLVAAYVGLGSDAEARELLTTLDHMQIDSPGVRIWREFNRAVLLERSSDLDGAHSSLLLALDEANEHGLRSKAADTHLRIRELALRRSDLASYVEHNNAYTQIKEEINGRDTATKLAMQEAERRIATERQEHQKHLAVLHSTLPRHIADRVARGEQVNDHYENASVIFVDIVGFTSLSELLSSNEVIQILDAIFTAFDDVCKKHDVVKIKTIGDSYMAVAFPSSVPHSVRNDTPSTSHSSEEHVIPSEMRNTAMRAASAAIDMLHEVSHVISPLGSPIQIRIGIHCGALTAGVIGTQRLQYDVWGDTVNVASRMESNSTPGRILVSAAFADALDSGKGETAKEQKGEMAKGQKSETAKGQKGETDVIPNEVRNKEHGTWHLALRGETELKGKGMMITYWLEPLISHSPME